MMAKMSANQKNVESIQKDLKATMSAGKKG
jgi:hypothetical protein